MTPGFDLDTGSPPTAPFAHPGAVVCREVLRNDLSAGNIVSGADPWLHATVAQGASYLATACGCTTPKDRHDQISTARSVRTKSRARSSETLMS